MTGGSRRERQARLSDRVRENPFLTDEELARIFSVSVQTIRLDRLALGIPELRERMRAVAERTYAQVQSLGSGEIVGDLVDIVPGVRSISILETSPDMAFEKTGIVRGHIIFAQADSLALALVPAEVVLTGVANIKYRRPVRLGERLVAKAEVLRRKANKWVVQVVTRVGQGQVFRGKWLVVAVEGGGTPPDGSREEAAAVPAGAAAGEVRRS